MKRILYFWSKFFKKLHSKAIVNSYIHPLSKVEAGSEITNSTFAKHSYCGYNCKIINTKIGSFTSIANNVIIGAGMHPIEWVGTSPVFYEGTDSISTKFSKHKRSSSKITTIGNDVWIGDSVLIKQGVEIGHGSVIGMGSVVTKNIEPYSIYAGNPAKLIRKRFDDKLINELLNICWWDLTDQELNHYAEFFTNPNKFVEKLKK